MNHTFVQQKYAKTINSDVVDVDKFADFLTFNNSGRGIAYKYGQLWFFFRP